MPGFFGYLFLASVFTLFGSVHFLILLCRRRQPAPPYGYPEFASVLVTYLIAQSIFTSLTLDSTLALVLPVYLAMPFATTAWWWLTCRQLRTANSMSRSVSCVLPPFYVPTFFLLPMLGGAMGNWPYGSLPRGIGDDLFFYWPYVFAGVHLFSFFLVLVSWFSRSSVPSPKIAPDSETLAFNRHIDDNPYSPPGTA